MIHNSQLELKIIAELMNFYFYSSFMFSYFDSLLGYKGYSLIIPIIFIKLKSHCVTSAR